ncbi:aminopeptidase [Candidatus Woesearchaeota archaeon]|nr:aminopeptidase [Candidatus Woesearchaeota archaeon]
MLQLDEETKTTSRILHECLHASKEDNVVLISDTGEHSSRLADFYAQSVKLLKAPLQQVIQESQKEWSTINKELVKILNQLPEKNIVILVVSNKLGMLGRLGKSFRRFCQQRKHRFISTTGLASLSAKTFSAMITAMDIDYMKMHMHGLWLKKQLDNASSIRMITDAGTDVTADIFGMQAISNTGNFHMYGTGGNIPAGEVYIAPRGVTNVNGTVVIDGSMRTDKSGKLLRDTITMTIKKGRVIDLEGNDGNLLEESMRRAEQHAKHPERVRIIGEIGIGINPKAQLIGTTIVDEKVMDTAHIAIGSNYWFGGANNTIFHADQVFKNPTIFIDGKRVNVFKNET